MTVVLKIRRALSFLAIVALLPLLSTCTGSSQASRSLSFDGASETAIVLIGTSVNRPQVEEVKAGRSLQTYWQEYDPRTGRLVADGESMVTSVGGNVFSEPEYLDPTVSVLEVAPGDYALIGAGFPHLMTTFVESKPSLGSRDPLGRGQSWTHTVDPRMHIEPEADVDNKRNFLFSVDAGQILYIGHFQFLKPAYRDGVSSIDYYLDTAAARSALKDFPRISGRMVIHDLTEPVETAAR